MFFKEVNIWYYIGYSINCSLLLTMNLQLPCGKVVNNSNSSFCEFLNFLKGCNSRAARSLPMGELILYDTSKGLPLVLSQNTMALNCSYFLHTVRNNKRDRSEGRKSIYKGLSSFLQLVLLKEFIRSWNGCWYRHYWHV